MTAGWRRCHSRAMKRFRSVLISMLAFGVSLASFSCACANTVPDSASEPAPHVHRHDGGAPENTDCADSGCGGNGGFDAVLPERAAALADAVDAPIDDDVELAPAVTSAPRSFATVPVHRPASPDLRLGSATPVARFDKLLN